MINRVQSLKVRGKKKDLANNIEAEIPHVDNIRYLELKVDPKSSGY